MQESLPAYFSPLSTINLTGGIILSQHTLTDFFKKPTKQKQVKKKKKQTPQKEIVCECGSTEFSCYLGQGTDTEFYWCSKCNRKSHYIKKGGSS